VKVRASVKPRCEHCKVIRRNRVVMIICSKDPKQTETGLRVGFGLK